jgi:hypothetical protein
LSSLSSEPFDRSPPLAEETSVMSGDDGSGVLRRSGEEGKMWLEGCGLQLYCCVEWAVE